MCSGGSKPKAPPPPVAPEPLKDMTEPNRRSRDRQKRLAAAAGGMAATNVTGGLGLPGPALTSNKTLLGQ